MSDHTEPDEKVIIRAVAAGGKSASNVLYHYGDLVSVNLIQADIAVPLNKNMSGIHSVIIWG
ncbi:hypothetical protein DDT52_16025 [Brenneria roseae subsp. roseae]|nr:hypothetical protein DDT52_16025 [Brenneria roseae subsp. roseae]